MNYYPRKMQELLGGERSFNKVRLIFGARQTGKSTLLANVLPKESSVIYNLQESNLRRQFEADPASLGKELGALNRRITHVVIDEIQKVPALLDEIQFLYDSAPNRWQFFLTGSSARRLRTHSSNLLPGRCHVYHLYPVTRSEEAGFVGVLD
jgi:uncharacterized protein